MNTSFVGFQEVQRPTFAPAPKKSVPTHLPILDVLRGLAILLVFLFHGLNAAFNTDTLAWDGWHRVCPDLSFFLLLPAYMGWCGVPIFFVISGFCIHWSHERSKKKSLSTFFQRRFFRIYPPYLIAVLFFAVVYPRFRLNFSSAHDITQLFAHLFMVHNLMGPDFFFGLNGTLWSVAVEVQLYFIYPLLLMLVARQGWGRALWITGGLEVVSRLVLSCFSWADPHTALWVTGNPLMYWFSWSIGAKVADDLIHGRALSFQKFPLWLWPSLMLVAWFIRPLTSFCFLFTALGTATFLARSISGGGFWNGSSRWLGYLGKGGVISYSIYLLHGPLQLTLGERLAHFIPHHHGTGTLLACSYLAGIPIVLIAWAFYHLTELPGVALGKWVMQGASPRPRPVPVESFGGSEVGTGNLIAAS